MMDSYLITGYFYLANKTGTISPQSGIQRYIRYATTRQKNEQLNDFSSIALITRVDVVVIKQWYSKCISNRHLLEQWASREIQFKARIKHRFTIKIVITYSELTKRPTIRANKQQKKKELTICCSQ